MASESIQPRTKGILQLAWPLVLSFWFRSLFQWVDTAYAARIEGLGDASIAAIGLTLPFEFMMTACWVGTSNALTSRLGAAMAAGEGDKVQQLLQSTKRLIFVLAGFFMIVAACIWQWAEAESFGLDPDIAKQFKIYGSVLLAGASITTFWSILPDSIVKAHHDMKTTMWAGLASSVLNVILNTLFMFVFGWGIFGIALATVLGRLGGLAYSWGKAAELERERIANQPNDKLGLFERPVKALIGLAIPASFAFVLMAVEGFVFNGLLVRSDQSVEYLAAWSILDRAGRFLIMPIIAIGVATLPLIARLSGSRDFARMRHEMQIAKRASFAFVLLLATPLAFFAGPCLARRLTETEVSTNLAILGLKYIPLGLLLSAPLLLARPAFEGLQQARPGLLLSLMRTLLFVIPLGTLGFSQAERFGREPLEGLLLGTAIGAGIVSLIATRWLSRELLALTK